MAGNIFSVSTGVTDAGGSAPRKVLPTLKSRTTLGAVRKSKSNIEAAEPPLSASHCLIFSPCGTAGSPQTARKTKGHKPRSIFAPPPPPPPPRPPPTHHHPPTPLTLSPPTTHP